MTTWFTPENSQEEIKNLTNRDFIRHLMVKGIKLSCQECGNENFFTLSEGGESNKTQLVHTIKCLNSSDDENIDNPVIISTCNNCGYTKLYNAYAVLSTKYEFSGNQSFPEEDKE